MKYIILISLFLSLLSCAREPLKIVYTANLNAYLESCKCEKPDLGGMIRLKTAVDKLRVECPDLLLIDSGDIFNTFTQIKQDSLQAEFLALLKYDFLNFGDQELVEGWDWIRQKMETRQLPLYSANLREAGANKTPLPGYKIFKRGGWKILMIGAISPAAFNFIREPGIEAGAVAPKIEMILREEKNNFDFAALLYHGSDEEAAELLNEFPRIDMCISGHTQEKFSREIDGRWLLQPGEGAEYLGVITLGGKEADKLSNEFLQVGRFYADDSLMRESLEKYYRDLKRGKI